MHTLRFFTRNEMGQLYIFETAHSYLAVYNEWDQLFRWSRLNWITFNLVRLEVDYNRFFWNHLTVDVTLFGFGLSFHLSTPTPEQEKAAEEETKDIKLVMGVHARMETLARALALRAAGDGLSQIVIDEAKDIVEILDGNETRLVDLTEVTDSPVKLKDLL